jgi:hypothetical protein
MSSLMFFPTASFAVKPKIFSADGLKDSMSPRSSMVMMP